MSTYDSEKHDTQLLRVSEKRVRMCTSKIVRTRLLSLVVLLAAFGSNGPAVSAPLQGDKELLMIVRDAYQANIERVATWQGHAEVKSESENLGYDRRRIESQVGFVYDRERQAVRWNWLDSADEAVVDNKTTRFRRSFVNKMLRNGTLYRLGPFDAVRKDTPYTLNINSSDGFRAVNTSDDFDPMLFLTHPTGNGGPSMVELLNMYYDNSDDPDIDATVTRKGDKVILHVDNESASLITHLEFDLLQGCALVSYSVSTPMITQTRTYEYEQISGVFVPKRFIYEHDTRKEGAKTKTRMREVVFTQNSINEPIPESEFSFESLGVQPGDRISDRLMGVAYAYKAIPKLPERLEIDPGSQELVAAIAAQEASASTQVRTAITGDMNAPDSTSRPPVAYAARPGNKANWRTTVLVLLFAGGICLAVACRVGRAMRRERTTSGKE